MGIGVFYVGTVLSALGLRTRSSEHSTSAKEAVLVSCLGIQQSPSAVSDTLVAHGHGPKRTAKPLNPKPLNPIP